MRLSTLSSIFFILPLVTSEYFEYVLYVKSPSNMKDTLVAHGKKETGDMYEIEEMRPYEDTWSELSACLDENGKDWTEPESLEEDIDCEKDRQWWALSRLSFKGDSTHSRPYNVTEGDTTMMCNITVFEEGESFREGEWMIGWGLREDGDESPVDIVFHNITESG